jgi:hypothetical protein
MSYVRATRYAQVVVLLTLLVGVLVLAREAWRQYYSHTERGETVTSSKTTSEKKSTSKGPESTEKTETSTAPNPNLPERLLGRPGLWVARALLLLVAAFLAGALVQRMLLGKFAFKVGGLEIPEVEAPVLPEFPPQLAAQFVSDVSSTAPSNFEPPAISATSAINSLLNQIMEAAYADYALIDLGTGRNWLTSRLFFFAFLLQRIRPVKTFVFVESRGKVAKRYVGMRSPDAVRWVLAAQYPALEQAFAKAYAELSNLRIISESGGLERDSASKLLENFFYDSRVRAMDHGEDEDNWVQLGPDRWEYAHWINGAMAINLFNLSPEPTSFVFLGEDNVVQNAFAELGTEGPLVALLDQSHRFLRLLDREALLESLAVQTRLKIAAVIALGQADPEEKLKIVKIEIHREESGRVPQS